MKPAVIVKCLLVLSLLSFLVFSGCSPQKTETSDTDSQKTIKTAKEQSAEKKPRPVVNLTEEEEKEVSDLLKQAENFAIKEEPYKAIELYDNAIKIDPNNIEAYLGKGRLCLWRQVNMHQSAYDAYTNVVDIDENNYEGLQGLGRSARELKRYGESEEALKKAIELKPDDPIIYGDLAMTLFFKGHTLRDAEERIACYRGAVENYKKAIELNPEQAGNYIKAMDALQLWLEIAKTKEPQEIADELAKEFESRLPDHPQKELMDKKHVQIQSIYIP